MQLLVLGGTRFVGRALVADALFRGWEVTVLNRGQTGEPPAGVTSLTADRTSYDAVVDALGGATFDAVVDTWSQAPEVVSTAVRALAGRTPRYAYISSESVYVDGRPAGGDESWPVVDGDPDAAMTDYAADKRGAELAVLRAFPEALLVRAGLILGPYEDVGRLPWWLARTARGGRVVAPGRPERPLQHVDARDLAAWTLDNLGHAGPVDLTSRSGHTTTRGLLEACVEVTGQGAELLWFTEGELEAAGAEPWGMLPCWVPEAGEFAGFMESDTSLAASLGLVCRPVRDTVADTWTWVQRDGVPPARTDRPALGLPPEVEQRLLALRG